MFVTTTMDCLHLIEGRAFVCILPLVMSFSLRSYRPTVQSWHTHRPIFMLPQVVLINSRNYTECFLDYLEEMISFRQVYYQLTSHQVYESTDGLPNLELIDQGIYIVFHNYIKLTKIMLVFFFLSAIRWE